MSNNVADAGKQTVTDVVLKRTLFGASDTETTSGMLQVTGVGEDLGHPSYNNNPTGDPIIIIDDKDLVLNPEDLKPVPCDLCTKPVTEYYPCIMHHAGMDVIIINGLGFLKT